MQQQILFRVITRWGLNSFGLWLSAWLFTSVSYGDDISSIIIAGLALSIVNAVVKPLVVILSLPAILISLGLFTIFVNGLMVYLAAKFVSGFEITTYSGAVLAGIIISLLNYWLTTYLEERIFKDKL